MMTEGSGGNTIIEMPFYFPLADDRIRVVVGYEDKWRPIFWFKVAKDGSIYTGPRLTNIRELRRGAKTIQGGSVSFRYDEGEVMHDPGILRSAKISFHASGVTHFAGERVFRGASRHLKQQEELCHIVFMHPSKYSAIEDSKVGERDVCLSYRFDESRPLAGLMLVSPTDMMRPVRISSAINQINLVFLYSKLMGVPDLVIQFVLYHGPIGSWAPFSYLIFGASAVEEKATNK